MTWQRKLRMLLRGPASDSSVLCMDGLHSAFDRSKGGSMDMGGRTVTWRLKFAWPHKMKNDEY